MNFCHLDRRMYWLLFKMMENQHWIKQRPQPQYTIEAWCQTNTHKCVKYMFHVNTGRDDDRCPYGKNKVGEGSWCSRWGCKLAEGSGEEDAFQQRPENPVAEWKPSEEGITRGCLLFHEWQTSWFCLHAGAGEVRHRVARPGAALGPLKRCWLCFPVWEEPLNDSIKDCCLPDSYTEAPAAMWIMVSWSLKRWLKLKWGC